MTEEENNWTTGYVSVIGFSYAQPIADLWSFLLKHRAKPPNQVQTSMHENGYATSIIMLTVALLESFIVRTKYIMTERGLLTSPSQAKHHPIEFYRSTFDNGQLVEEIKETFVVRDLIFHNHIWSSDVSVEGEMRFVERPKLFRDVSGDKKFRSCVDMSTRRTRLLGMNVFPTRINRRDAAIITDVAYRALLSIEKQDRMYCYISHQHLLFRRRPISLQRAMKLIGRMCKASEG